MTEDFKLWSYSNMLQKGRAKTLKHLKKPKDIGLDVSSFRELFALANGAEDIHRRSVCPETLLHE